MLQVVADLDRKILALELKALKSRMLQNVGNGVRVRHGEGTRPAGRRVVLLRAVEELLDDRLGAVQPLVVELASPDDDVQPPTGPQSPRRTLRSAATGFAKNIVPNRANA